MEIQKRVILLHVERRIFFQLETQIVRPSSLTNVERRIAFFIYAVLDSPRRLELSCRSFVILRLEKCIRFLYFLRNKFLYANFRKENHTKRNR